MLLIDKEEVPRIPLFFQINNIAYNKNLKGLEPYPSSLYFFYGLEWTK